MAAKKKVTKPDPLSDSFAGPLLPVYLVYGNEHSDVSRAVRRLVELALEGDPADTNCVWLEGTNTSHQEIRSQATTVPFIAPKRVVIVRDAKALPADEQNALAPHLKELPETTLLLFEVRSDGAEHGLSQALSKAVRATGETFRYAQLDARSNALPARVQEIAAEHGKGLSRSTCHYLLRRTGTDLSLVRSEIAKLAAYVEPAQQITNRDVDALVIKSVEESVFQLIDAVATGRAAPALNVLAELLAQGEAPERLLPLLLRQYQLLRQAKFLLDAGLRPNQWKSLPEEILARLPDEPNFVSSVGSRRWLCDKTGNQARNLSWQQLTAAPQLLLTADLQLKGADGQQRDRRIVLETLVCQLCAGR